MIRTKHDIIIGLLSKYRSQLMGIAMIWVMLFHFFLAFGRAPLKFLSAVGYAGVDIFFFLSGFGLYSAFMKSRTVCSFYQRRFVRLFPIYIFILLVEFICYREYGFLNLLINCLGLGYWVNLFVPFPYKEWYIPTLILFYFVFPCFIFLSKKIHSVKNAVKIFCFIGLSCELVLIFFQDAIIYHLTVSRIPIFFIGALFGYYFTINPKRRIPLILLVSSCIGLILEIFAVRYVPTHLMWNYGLHWLPFMFIIPGLCYTLTVFFEYLPKKINIALMKLGQISLEVYLVHISIIALYSKLVDRYLPNSSSFLWVNFLIFLIVSIILARLCNLIIGNIKSILFPKRIKF